MPYKYPAVSLILSSLRPENLTWLTRLRHRPSYELRAYVNQYICKFFLCFFSRVRPAYFFIIMFSLSLSSLTSQLITEHTLLDLLFNALVCVFYFCITICLNLKLWYTFAGHGPAPREFFLLARGCVFNCDREGRENRFYTTHHSPLVDP